MQDAKRLAKLLLCLRKNNEIIKTLTAVCLKMDNKEHREGILKVINELTTDNMHNLDHIPNEHWYEKS